MGLKLVKETYSKVPLEKSKPKEHSIHKPYNPSTHPIPRLISLGMPLDLEPLAQKV
jgi:hypothetical protein